MRLADVLVVLVDRLLTDARADRGWVAWHSSAESGVKHSGSVPSGRVRIGGVARRLDVRIVPRKGAVTRTVCMRWRRNNQGMARTVLIVDDHPSFRTSARRVLEDAGYEVIGEAQDGESGVAAAQALRPALVLLDVQLPDLDGFHVAARITSQDDAPIVVLTSSRDGSEFFGLVGRSGARGFIPKAELSGPALEVLLR